ncbi:MAG: preprotein translocase subunit SecE [Alphaproteobacteria bacterium]
MATEVAERDDHEQERKRSGPMTFWKEVRAEARKVTWATQNETLVSTIMVVIMVIMAAIFFFAVDSVIHIAISLILGLVK